MFPHVVYLSCLTTGIKTRSFTEVRKSSLGTGRVGFCDDVPDKGWCSNRGENNPRRVSGVETIVVVVIAGNRAGVANK